MVGVEVVQIQELELIALGQEPGLDLFARVIDRRGFRARRRSFEWQAFVQP